MNVYKIIKNGVLRRHQVWTWDLTKVSRGQPGGLRVEFYLVRPTNILTIRPNGDISDIMRLGFRVKTLGQVEFDYS